MNGVAHVVRRSVLEVTQSALWPAESSQNSAFGGYTVVTNDFPGPLGVGHRDLGMNLWAAWGDHHLGMGRWLA